MKKDRLIFFGFLVLFFSLGLYLRLKTLKAPYLPYLYNYDILTHLQSSSWEILLSSYHHIINIYRNVVSNFLFRYFGVNEATYRIFSIIASLGTMVLIYRFTLKTIGRNEAAIGVLLFGCSYFSIFSCLAPKYSGFYMFASLATFICLWRGFIGGKSGYWIGFAVLNFLNLTNCLVAAVYMPVLLAIAGALAWSQFKTTGEWNEDLKKKVIFLGFGFFISVGLAIVLYFLRGLNLIQQVINIVVLKKVDPNLANDGVAHYQLIENIWVGLKTFLYTVYIRLNFNLFEFPVDPGLTEKLNFAYCVFIFLSTFGMRLIYLRNKILFKCMLMVFLVPIVVNVFILRQPIDKFVSFIIPFLLIAVSAGFVSMFRFLDRWEGFKPFKTSAVLFSGFLFFSCIIQPKPIWSSQMQDQMFNGKGIRSVTEYIENHIKPNDIILNVTRLSSLEGKGANAIHEFDHPYYLSRFYGEHRMELLAERTGRVGVWAITTKPLEDSRIYPFYFPKGYVPKIVKKVNGCILYYGEMEIIETKSINDDQVFDTPFWLFIKGRSLHERMLFDKAQKYYNRFLDKGFNVDRGFYNLALINLPKNKRRALKLLDKAIAVIETPTSLAMKAQIERVDLVMTLDSNGRPRAQVRNGGLRYVTSKSNGFFFREYLMEDFIYSQAKEYYGQYYFLAGILIRSVFSETEDERFFEMAKTYFMKGLKIHRKGRFSGVATRMILNKHLNLAVNISLIPIDLKFAHQEFPNITY